MKSNIKPGTIFPDYKLPDQTGNKRKLSELQSQDPVAFNHARGGYYPQGRSSTSMDGCDVKRTEGRLLQVYNYKYRFTDVVHGMAHKTGRSLAISMR